MSIWLFSSSQVLDFPDPRTKMMKLCLRGALPSTVLLRAKVASEFSKTSFLASHTQRCCLGTHKRTEKLEPLTSAKGAKDFIYSLHPQERTCLLKELQNFESIAIAQGKMRWKSRHTTFTRRCNVLKQNVRVYPVCVCGYEERERLEVLLDDSHSVGCTGVGCMPFVPPVLLDLPSLPCVLNFEKYASIFFFIDSCQRGSETIWLSCPTRFNTHWVFVGNRGVYTLFVGGVWSWTIISMFD